MIITKFEPKNLDALRPVIQNGLSVLERYGLTATIGKMTYSDTSFSAKLEVTTGNNGESEFKKNASMFNLKPGWFGKKFDIKGETYEVIGLDTNRRRFPVVLRTSTGKTVTYAPDALRMMLGDAAEVAQERRQELADNWNWLKHSEDAVPGVQFEWLGQKITMDSDGAVATVIGLDRAPFGRKKPRVVIETADKNLKVATAENFISIMKQFNRKLLKARKAA